MPATQPPAPERVGTLPPDTGIAVGQRAPEVAVSVDQIEQAAKTKAMHANPIAVLVDPDLAAHRAFRVIHHADDAEVARLKGYGLDIERSSGRTHHDFAIPSVFVIDRGGVVRWAHADPDYKVRPSPAQLLAAIDGLHLSHSDQKEREPVK